MQHIATTTRLLAGVAALLLVAACVQTETSMDRERLYASVEDLRIDSDLVVVGTVTSSREVADIEGSESILTISDIEIVKVVASSERRPTWAPGQTINVRQFGAAGSRDQSPPVPLVSRGGNYLLFLTLSGLDGELSEQFYVTGASAGLFEPMERRERKTAEVSRIERFRQVAPSDVEPDLQEASLSELW